MSGHYEYSDWTGDNVWVEDPPAAKVAPAAPVVAAGLPALAAAKPVPVAAAPVAAPPAGHYEYNDWAGDNVWVADTPEYTAQVNAQKAAADDAAAKKISDLAKSGMGSTFNQIDQYLAANPNTSEYTDPKTGLVYSKNVDLGGGYDSGIAGTGETLGYNTYNPKTNQIVNYDTSGNITYNAQKQKDKGFLGDLMSSPIMPILIGVLAPELIPSLGAWAAPAVNAAIGVASGKDPLKIIENAALSYVGSQVAQGVGGLGDQAGAASTYGTDLGSQQTAMLAAQDAGMGTASDVAGNLAGKVAGQIVSSGGKIDPVAALLSGGLSEGTNAILGQIDGFSELSKGEQAAVKNIVTQTLQTGNLSPQALVNSAIAVGNSAADASKATDPYFQTGAGTGAATPDYPTNDVGFQQLVDELNKTPAATGQSVQVASNDNASALAALEDAKTAAKIDSGQTVDLGEVSNKPPDAELPPGLNFPGDQSTPAEAQQQQAVDDLQAALTETQQPETPAPIPTPDIIAELQDAGLTNEQIGIPTPPSAPEAPAEPAVRATAPTQAEQQPAVEELIKQLEATQPAPVTQTVEQILASEPPPVVNPVAPPPADVLKPASVPTQAEQQPAIQELIKQIELTQPTAQTVEQILAAEPPPVTNQISPPPEPAPETPVTRSVAPAVAQVIAEAEKTPTPEQTVEQILASEPPPAVSQVVPETLAPTPEERVPPPEQTIEQIMAAEPAPAVSQVAPEEPVTVPTQTEQQPAVENFIKQLEQYQAPEPTVEQILASEPPPAGVPAETPTPEVTPEVQALIDQAVTGQQESAQAGQPAIDQQTQQLLSDLSGGTDTGVTPAETPRSIDNQIAADEQAKADAEAAQAETDKLAATHPDPVQALIDQVTNTDQPAIDQQTQDLLNELSGGTDNGVTSPIDYSGISDILSGGQTEAPEEDIPTIDVTGKRPTDDSEPGWEGWTPPPTPIDYSGISDMLTGGQSETPPTEQAPAVSIPKIPTTTPAVAPVKTVAPVAKKPAAAPKAAASSIQEYMPSIGDVAHIKSLESLFGPILGTLLAEQTNEKQDDSLSALEGMDQEYASGGHVDDFSVEALLHILRS